MSDSRGASWVTAASLLDDVIEHGDEMGHLANATGDELRDALALAAERLRGLSGRPVRAAIMFGSRRLVTEVWRLVEAHTISSRSPAADAALDLRDTIDSRWEPTSGDPDQDVSILPAAHPPPALPNLTRAQSAALYQLADGDWHQGARTLGLATVLSTVASSLCQLGLAEREGQSKTVYPNGPGYRYRITDAGRAWLAATEGPSRKVDDEGVR